MTPYQKTQAAAAIAAGCVALAITFLVWPKPQPAKTPALAQAEKAQLRDAVSAIPATPAAAAAAAMPPGFVHATSLAAMTPLEPAKTVKLELSAEDHSQARTLAATSGVSAEKLEAMRERGMGWDAIARKVGFRTRSAKVFAKRGIIIGQRFAKR